MGNLLSSENRGKLKNIVQKQLVHAQQAADQGLNQLTDFEGKPLDIKKLQNLALKNGGIDNIENTVKQLSQKAQHLYQSNQGTINKIKKQNLREIFDEAFKNGYDNFDHPDPEIERDLKQVMRQVYVDAIKKSAKSRKSTFSINS